MSTRRSPSLTTSWTPFLPSAAATTMAARPTRTATTTALRMIPDLLIWIPLAPRRAQCSLPPPVLQSPAMSPASPPSAAALVTGASRGLGRGIAEALSRDGLDVAIHYGTRRAAAEETEAACRKVATRGGQKFALVTGG